MRIKFSVKSSILEKANNKYSERVTIVIEDKKTKFFLPHPVTDFIKTKYARDDNHSTQKGAAEAIVQFLNWVFFENEGTYQLKSISGLKVKHGIDYLNFCNEDKGNKLNTLILKERYLNQFYFYLKSKKIIEEIELFGHFDSAHSIFAEDRLKFPSRHMKRMKLNDFPDRNLITPFIETALEIAPEIALGIYFEIFGGLRRGEVINLTLDSLRLTGSYGSKGISVDIQKHPELHTRLRTQHKEGVKNPRIQPIVIVEYLPNILKLHLNKVKKYENKSKALFLDENQHPMSGAVYEKEFQKVKNLFLKRLQEYGSPWASYLNKYSWSTHIGRGIYSNLMTKLVKSPYELALLRGDKNINSALVYMSQMRVQNEIQAGLEGLYTASQIRQLNERLQERSQEQINKEREMTFSEINF
ncbi:hypothetical protein ACQCVL_17015 [Bacillus thuringiensis]|uniref:hypothetical protein n=1 Tax=Bacillus thuringiensis TaxID=1428 RepID=UPI003CF9B282